MNIPLSAPHDGMQGGSHSKMASCGSGILSPQCLHMHSGRSETKDPAMALNPIESLKRDQNQVLLMSTSRGSGKEEKILCLFAYPGVHLVLHNDLYGREEGPCPGHLVNACWDLPPPCLLHQLGRPEQL